MSTKDFAETLVDAFEYAIKKNQEFGVNYTEEVRLRRADLIQALRVPPPPSEDLPDTCAFADVAALQGLLASGADDTWTTSQNVQKALDYSDALIKARKAREVKA